MEIISLLKTRQYAAIAAISAAVMAIVYPILQSIINLENIDLWFTTSPLQTLIFYPAFSILFGVLVALQVHRAKSPKTCSIKKAGSAGAAGTIIAFLVGACPACAGLATLLLPAGAALFVTANTLLFNVIAIAFLLLGIAMLGGFRKAYL